jgi:hypothetical protein
MVVFESDARPVLVWSDARGVHADNGAPIILDPAPGASFAVARRGNGRILVAIGLAQGGRKQIEIRALESGGWITLGRRSNLTLRDLVPWGKDGYALLYTDKRSQSFVEIHDSTSAKGVRYRLWGKFLEGSIEQLPDGSLGVLYGRSSPKAHRKDLDLAVLRSGHFHYKAVYTNLQCDLGEIGFGVVGHQARLAYGYGCDVGWGLYTIAGKEVYNPFAGDDSGMTYPQGFASAGGRIAFVHSETNRHRLSIRIIGP